MNSERTCRCCKAQINSKPILCYENMPKAAQFFPTKEDLNQEKGVKLELYQCLHCGLIQLLDEPVSYYRDVIRAAAILIMAASYSDEVAGIVKQMCGNMAVGILRDYGVEQIKD